MGSLGLLIEACKTCENSFSENDDDACDEEPQNLNSGILYCKARRMPLDHTKENAVLLFSSGEERAHGAELQCSHPICRENGVKFRYCAPCQKAVAKRNFRKRHAHNDPLTAYDPNKRRPLHPICSENIQHSMCAPMGTNHREECIQIAASVQHDSDYFINDTYQSNFHTVSTENTVNTVNLLHHQGETNTSNYEQVGNAIMHVPQSWIDLFHGRPQNGDKDQIKMWLIRAMDIAKVSTDTCRSSTNSLNSNASSQYIPYDPVTTAAVKEEFTGVVPPRCMSVGKIKQHLNYNTGNFRDHTDDTPLHIKTEPDEVLSDSVIMDSKGSALTISSNEEHLNSNIVNFRDHTDDMPLHIKTEPDEVASNSLMLGSNGSIIITTPNIF